MNRGFCREAATTTPVIKLRPTILHAEPHRHRFVDAQAPWANLSLCCDLGAGHALVSLGASPDARGGEVGGEVIGVWDASAEEERVSVIESR